MSGMRVLICKIRRGLVNRVVEVRREVNHCDLLEENSDCLEVLDNTQSPQEMPLDDVSGG